MPNKLQLLRQKAFDRQHGRCCYCGVPMWLKSPSELCAPVPSPNAAKRLRCTAEHLLPRSDGGQDRSDNIAAACARCNHTRHKQKLPGTPDAFANKVLKRVVARSWHEKWVYDQGLL
jgi:5-methylcytosine-specific restriction endonuclease McrA